MPSGTATLAHRRPWPIAAEALGLAGPRGLAPGPVPGEEPAAEGAGGQAAVAGETDRIFVETLRGQCLNPPHSAGRHTAVLGMESPDMGKAWPL